MTLKNVKPALYSFKPGYLTFHDKVTNNSIITVVELKLHSKAFVLLIILIKFDIISVS